MPFSSLSFFLLSCVFHGGGSSFNSFFCLLFFFFRGLALTCKALQNMQNDTNSEAHTCFKKSYDEILGHHHSFIIRSVVSVSFCLFPWPPKKITISLICSYCNANLPFLFFYYPILYLSSYYFPGIWITSP